MRYDQLPANTPIHILYQRPVLNKKTYSWLQEIGATTLEEMAVAFSVDDNQSLFVTLPREIRAHLVEMGLKALTKAKAERKPLPNIDVSIADQTFLQGLFVQRLKLMSSRYVKHCFENSRPSYKQLLPLFGISYFEYLLKYGAVSETRELYDLVQWFEMQYTEVISRSNSGSEEKNEPTCYPSMHKREQCFIDSFRKKHNHSPLWYILYRLLINSKQRNHEIYKQIHGIGIQAPKRLKEVAKAFQLTATQIQNIEKACREQLCQDLIPNADWKPYEALFQRPFLSTDDPLVQQIAQQELPGQPVRQLFPLLLTTGAFKQARLINFEILLNVNQYSNSALNCAERWVKYKVSLENHKIRAVPDEFKQFEQMIIKQPELKALMRYMLSKSLQQEISEEAFEDWITKRPKPLMADQLYEIIKQQGKPMYGKEILAIYNQQHPENPIQREVTLGNILRAGNKIKPIGRRSLYGLSEWEHIFYGTIADYVVAILSQSDIPLTLPELWEKVQAVYPMSTKHSMENLIKNDTTKRFVKYSKQRIGLKGKEYPERYKPYTGQYVKTFEEYLYDLKDYIHKHHELPIHYHSNKGRSLYNWFLEYRKGRLTLTTKQKEQITSVLKNETIIDNSMGT